MKKILAIAAFSLLVSTQAFASDSVVLSLDTTGKTFYGEKGATAPTIDAQHIIGKTSTGVGLGAKSGAGGYAMVTQHKSGSRAFGTAFDSTSVYYKDVTVNSLAATITTPGATDSTVFTTVNWTSM